MPEERSLPPTPAPTTPNPAPSESDHAFEALARAGARDGEVRCFVAALLDAQDLPEEKRNEIWHAFLAAGDIPPRRGGSD
jgi:hypothetical protein